MNGLADLALRGLAGMLSPAGPRGRLAILIYHRVLAESDPVNDWDPTASAFEAQMRALTSHFRLLPLSEAVRRLKAGSLPARAACVTFDDGYADNAEIALPILKRCGVPATFFIATGYLNGGRMWNDTVVEALRRAGISTLTLEDTQAGALAIDSPEAKRRAIKKLLSAWKYLPFGERQARADALAVSLGSDLPNDLMMRDDQVRELRTAGMEIGAHTETHPILARIPAAEARSEVIRSRDYLQALLGQPIGLFAYPNGKPRRDYTAEHVQLVRDAGFDAAVTTGAGAAFRATDAYELPRFTPWDRDPFRFSARLVGNLRTRPSNAADSDDARDYRA